MRRTNFTNFINKLWDLFTFRYLPAIFLLMGAGLCFSTILVAQPIQARQSWWGIPLRHSQVLSLLVALSILAFLSFTFRWFEKGMAPPSKTKPSEFKYKTFFRMNTIGFFLMLVGTLTIGADWVLSQQSLPPALVSIPAGKWSQTYPTQTTDFSTQVMLPSEFSLSSISYDSQTPSAQMLFRKNADSQGDLQSLRVFQPLLVEKNYWTLLGVEFSNEILRAVITPEDEQAIPAVAAIGQTVQFRINGPKYTITNIDLETFPELGPFVTMTDESGKQLNIFTKPILKHDLPEDKVLPHFQHGFWVSSIEASPSAIVMISPEPKIELLLPGLLIVVIGVVFLIISSDSSLLLGVQLSEIKKQTSSQRESREGM